MVSWGVVNWTIVLDDDGGMADTMTMSHAGGISSVWHVCVELKDGKKEMYK